LVNVYKILNLTQNDELLYTLNNDEEKLESSIEIKIEKIKEKKIK
jgi:hypothetical protein